MTSPTREEHMAEWDKKLAENGVPVSTKFDPEPPPVKSSLPRVTTTTRKASDPKSGNEKKAAQAVEVLAGLNGTLCLGLMMATMVNTAVEISSRDEVFREQAYAALLTDPKLCDRINRMSGTSGLIGLLSAYVMLAIGVMPTAREDIGELKSRIAERRAHAS